MPPKKQLLEGLRKVRVNPPVVVKRCSEAEAGELIRFPIGGGAVLALVAVAKADKVKESDRQLLILLEPVDERRAPPRFVGLGPGEDPSILSYGNEYEFRFDPSDVASIDVGGSRLYQSNGTIILSGRSAFLRVSPLEIGRYSGDLHYDIATGLLVRAPTNPDRALVGKWEIRLAGQLHAAPMASPPLMRFAAD